MRSGKYLYIVFFVVLPLLSPAQTRTIYLGSAGDSLFESDRVIITNPPEWTNQNTFFRFFDYETFHHDPTSQSSNKNTNRDGVVLSAKRTENLLIKAEASFGKKDDTCFISYDAEIEKITTGRSATVSILNLFSKKSENR